MFYNFFFSCILCMYDVFISNQVCLKDNYNKKKKSCNLNRRSVITTHSKYLLLIT